MNCRTELIKLGNGWYNVEFDIDGNNPFIWSSNESSIHILDYSILYIELDINVSKFIKSPYISIILDCGTEIKNKIQLGCNTIKFLCNGVNTVKLKTDTFNAGESEQNNDPRNLGIQLSKITLYYESNIVELPVNCILRLPPSLIESKSIVEQHPFITKVNLPNTNRIIYYNSCIFEIKNGIFICSRRDESTVDRRHGRDSFNFEDVKSNSLSIFKLDESYQPIEEIQLDIPLEFDGEQLEDPRVLVGAGKILISCSSREDKSNKCQIKLIVLDHDFKYISTIHPIYDGNADKVQNNTKTHKNWGWFWYDGKLHAVIYLNPFTVVEFDLTGKAVKEYIHKDFDFSWKYGKCNGGTNPIFNNGKFKAAFHSRENVDSSCIYYVIYHSGNYEFEPIPPFKPIQHSKIPVLSGNVNDSNTAENLWVVFPMGNIIKNNKIITSFGLNDRYTYIMENLI